MLRREAWNHTAQICMVLHNRLSMGGSTATLADFHPLLMEEAERESQSLAQRVAGLTDGKDMTNAEIEKIWEQVRDG